MTARRLLKIWSYTCVLAAFAVLWTGHHAFGQPYYAGKTIELIIPRGPGGGADSTGRHHAQLLSKFIPGNPRIRVVNNPGGALVFNDLYFRGRPDGLTIALSTGGDALRWAIGAPGFEFDLAKMRLIASSGQSTVIYTRPDVATTAAELLQRNLLRAGHTGRDGSMSLPEEMSSKALGLNVRRVFGYQSYGEVELAVLRGELDLGANNTLGYLESAAVRVEEGEFVPLYHMGFVAGNGQFTPDPRLPGVPLFSEVYREVTGQDLADSPYIDAVEAAATLANIGYTFWVHQETPDEIYNTLVKAWEAMVASEEFRELTRQRYGTEENVLVGERAQAVFNRLTSLPDEIRAGVE